MPRNKVYGGRKNGGGSRASRSESSPSMPAGNKGGGGGKSVLGRGSREQGKRKR